MSFFELLELLELSDWLFDWLFDTESELLPESTVPELPLDAGGIGM